jgi:hypothetical protein
MAGGGNPQQTQAPMGAQPMAQPMQPQGGQPNVYDQSAGAYNAALGGTQQAMAGPNIGAFMNPYQDMVTGGALNDLERQRQMATNTMDAQAGQAGAFGGSRHGVAQGATNEGFARQGANMFAGLQSQGFNTALGGAKPAGYADAGRGADGQPCQPRLWLWQPNRGSTAGARRNAAGRAADAY